MRSIILLIGLIISLSITSCKPDVTSPEENKIETFVGFAVGDSGKIYKSTNKGVNWFSLQSGTTSKLNAVCVLTDAITIVVGNDGVIIKTTDRGNTWNVQQSGTTVNLTKISFNKQTNQCWISGEQGLLLISNNF